MAAALTRPSSAPMARPIAEAAQMSRPKRLHNCAASTADRLATAPTDRSMPPVRMTRLSPSATMPKGRKFWLSPRSEAGPA